MTMWGSNLLLGIRRAPPTARWLPSSSSSLYQLVSSCLSHHFSFSLVCLAWQARHLVTLSSLWTLDAAAASHGRRGTWLLSVEALAAGRRGSVAWQARPLVSVCRGCGCWTARRMCSRLVWQGWAGRPCGCWDVPAVTMLANRRWRGWLASGVKLFRPRWKRSFIAVIGRPQSKTSSWCTAFWMTRT